MKIRDARRAQTADLAVAPLTITKERQRAVDFSVPFLTLGITILYAKPEQVGFFEQLFQFLKPLQAGVCTYS